MQHGWLAVLGCGTVCAGGMDVVQVALMDVVGSAAVAMDAHWGVAAVAEEGLSFMRNLSWVDANKVNVNVNELRLGFSNTARNPEGILSHNNRES